MKAGEDFFVGYSPERIDPGNEVWKFKNTPKVISGINDISTKKVQSFYDSIIDNTVLVNGTKEAEIRKQIKEFEEEATAQEQLQIATGKINVRQLIEQNNEAKKLADNAAIIEDSFKRLSDTITQDIGNGIKGLINEEGNLIKRTIRDLYNNDVNEIWVSGEDGFNTARDYIKQMIPNLSLIHI